MAKRKRPEPVEQLTPGIQLDRVPLADLDEDPENERQHDARNIEAIAASLTEFGQVLPLLVKGRRIIGGHGTKRAMESLGWTHADVARAEHLTDVQVRGLRIALNRTAELATWDEVSLQKSLADLAEFRVEWPQTLGFTDLDVKNLAASVAAMQTAAMPVVQDEPVGEVEARTQPGDLWVLGTHRLLCGDSTKREDVARVFDGAVPLLMVTDPPYGVEYQPEWREGHDFGKGNLRVGKVNNDHRVDWSEAFRGDVAYVWHASVFTAQVAHSIVGAGYEIRNSIIWAKPFQQISRGHYHWQHEPCWYAVRAGRPAGWNGDRTQTTLWSGITPIGDAYGRNKEERTDHSTQKPVECMARPIRNHGKAGDGVYDPFVGSGTTIIAAEQLGRCCFAIEISPAYCDMAVARWERLTGRKAERQPA